MKPSIAVILGSAFQYSLPEVLNLKRKNIATKWGEQEVFALSDQDLTQPAYLIFRHGLPHKLLPNQINYRAQAAALKKLNCNALVITSSVGVMDPDLPLYKPMLLSDMVMLENRLPDGSACTMFTEPSEEHGHLVLNDGLFSPALGKQLKKLDRDQIFRSDRDIVFAYVGGPRTKTKAENRIWPQLGVQVNSMTLAPETVLANELEIPTAGLVIGHKYSVPDIKNPGSDEALSDTLDSSREVTEKLIIDFLKAGKPVPFGNQIYRFNGNE